MTNPEQSKLEGEPLARRCVEICEERKAEDIVLYDVRGLSLLTDYTVICSGTSQPHLRALANHLRQDLGEEGVSPARIDGAAASRWIVMDYGTVLIHIFHPDLRQYYEIEKLFDRNRLICSANETEAG